MTKTELIAAVAAKTGQKKTDVESAIGEIINQVVASDKTSIKGFGTFEWRTRPARSGRNPKTGEKIDIPESTTLHFKPSAGLREL